jgi:hypothetical protein
VHVSGDFLRIVLAYSGVPIQEWGNGKSKTIEDLADEINEGESYLTLGADGLTRVLEVVKMHILEDGNPGRGKIHEIKIDSPDKDHTVGGKKRKNETIMDALARELREELGTWVITYSAKYLNTEYKDKQPSKSYPGLHTVYAFHHCEVLLKHGCEALLHAEFSVEEENGTVHHFKWK